MISILSPSRMLSFLHMKHITKILHPRYTHPILRCIFQRFLNNLLYITIQTTTNVIQHVVRIVFDKLIELFYVHTLIQCFTMNHFVENHTHRPTIALLTVEGAKIGLG